jgi:hypothetical protein
MIGSTGPRALCSWCDGKLSQRTAHEIVVATFHSIVAIGFVLAAAAGLWVLMNQDKFNSFAEVCHAIPICRSFEFFFSLKLSLIGHSALA